MDPEMKEHIEKAESTLEFVKDYVDKNSAGQDEDTKKKTVEMVRRIIEEGKTPGEALEMSNEDLVLVYTFGYKLFETGKYKDAYNLFFVLNILFPMNSAIAMALGACRQRMEDWKGAVEMYLAAAFLDKADPLPALYAYECYEKLQEPKLALLMLETVIYRCENIPQFAPIKQKSEIMLEGAKARAENQKEPGLVMQDIQARNAQIWKVVNGK